MLRNYLITAIRNLLKHKLFSVINIAGLALGMACCFLILLYIRHEFSYDQFHERAARIFRVNYHAGFGNTDFTLASVPPPISPKMPEYFPEVEKTARMFGRSITVSIKDDESGAPEKYEVEDLYFSDSTILDIFTFAFLEGNAETALSTPFSAVITEETARQFFGTGKAVGRTIHLMDQYPFEVKAVVKAFPAHSHIRFDLLVPYDNMYDIAPEASRQAMRDNLNSNWIISHSHTYVLLKEGALPEAVDKRFTAFLELYGDEKVRDKQTFSLYPLLDIHLHSQAGLEPSPPANLTYLYIFLGIGFITLLIACINFINFSTAASLSRAREVGIRKVMGAGKRSLAAQFLGESMLLAFGAFLLSVGLVYWLLPLLNDLLGQELRFDPMGDWPTLLIFFAIFLMTGMLAGSYPAFFVTRFKPVSVLKGKSYANLTRGGALRKVLITTQFVASIVLIAGTIGIYRQLQHLRNLPMGFQEDYMLSVPLFNPNINSIFGGIDASFRQKTNTFEEKLLSNPHIEAVTLSDRIPGFGAIRHNITTEQISREDNLYLPVMSVDYDFAETYRLEVIAGRDFDQSFGTDHQDAFVINEQAVKTLKWDSPESAIGQPLTKEGKQGKVVGVVRDFHTASLHTELDPLVMEVNAGSFTGFSIRISASAIPEAIAFSGATWDAFFPHKTFEYTFLNEDIDALYNAEDQLAGIIGYFALLAVLISCFGLYGLVAYATVQKTKEIGIRKVLGASISDILVLLSRQFFLLILVAGLIALPLAWYGFDYWLRDYPFNVAIGWWFFLLPLVSVLFIAGLTISYRAIRAAGRNPVEALRYE